MHRLKHIVHYKEKPGGISWDKECSTAAEAHRFVADVEEAGGIAIYIEDFEVDNIAIGSLDQQQDDEDESN